MKKLTIIDGQVFQSAAWHRGMGKYSYELLKHLIPKSLEEKGDVEIIFTTKLPVPEDVEALLAEYKKVRRLELDLALPKEPRTERNVQDIRVANKQVLNNHYRSDSYSEYGSANFLILSVYLDEVCSVFPDDIDNKLLVYYDSIPYLYHERYGQFQGFFDHFYLPHTATVYEADKLLTISGTVANDLKIFFGIPDRKLLNIDGAYIAKPKTDPIKPGILGEVTDFILMPSGQELRKNNLRAIRAFRSYVNATKSKTKLVITSFFSDEVRKELEMIGGGSVIFTGNVSNEEMAWLYENNKAILFASEYEGLGLPVLEAVNDNKIVLCSDIPVFKEISEDAFFYFDPLDEDDIKQTLIDTLPVIEKVANSKTKHYASIRKKYTWERSAGLVAEALEAKKSQMVNERKKIAILCPDPSGFSAIGKVVAESHPTYSDYFDIDYYFDRGPGHREVRPNLLKYAAAHYQAAEFNQSKYDQYEGVIYHIGNSEYHLETIRAALTMPGYAILHDTHLDGAYANLVEAGYITAERLELESCIDEAILQESGLDHLDASKLASVVNNQKAIITHSQYALKAVSQLIVEGNTVRMTQLNLPVDTTSQIKERSQLQRPVIALAGIIAGIKGINIIESIAQNPKFAHCLVKIFGFSFAEPESIERLSLLPNVEIASNPSDFQFQRNMSTVDILVNVRKHYHGETSLTTLEAMRYGVAVVVKKVGWYDELPENAVRKVENEDQVEEVLSDLLSNTANLSKINRNALDLIVKEFNHDQYAKGMYDIVSH